MLKNKWVVALCVLSSLCFADKVRLKDAKQAREIFGLSPTFDSLGGVQTIRAAVIDSGFGTADERAAKLPKHTLVEQYKNAEGGAIQTAGLQAHNHGVEMSQVMCGILGDAFNVKDKDYYPDLYLLNGSNKANLSLAVDYAIAKGIKVVLYSNNFEVGGYGNGEGPINAIVKKATDGGIIWINSAGNYGQKVYNGLVDLKLDRGENIYYAQFKDEKGAKKDYLEFTSITSQNIVDIILLWDGFSEKDGTEKDLNITVEDSDRKVVAEYTPDATNQPVNPFAGKMIQVRTKDKYNPGENILSFEKLHVMLKADETYRIKVTASHASALKFDEKRDGLRVAIVPKGYGDTIRFPLGSRTKTLMTPADSKDAIVVGFFGVMSSLGPTFSDPSLWKPDVMAPLARATFDNGDSLQDSTSVAAAYFAGVVVNLLTYNPRIKRADLMDYLKTLPVLNRDKVEQIKTETQTVPAQAKKDFPAIFKLLKDGCKVEPRAIGKNADGRYYVVLETLPSELKPYFAPLLQNVTFENLSSDAFELYLHQHDRLRRGYDSGTLLARPRELRNGKPHLPPWSSPAVASVLIEPRSRDHRKYIELIIDRNYDRTIADMPEEALRRRWVAPSKPATERMHSR